VNAYKTNNLKMTSLKAVIIDDEPKLRTVLEIKLKDKCPTVQLVGSAGNVKEGYDAILKTKPDLVFLDIAMPGGSGFDLIDKFDEINFDVIFVTGFNQYAIDALRVSAIDYLLKPVRSDDLIQAVDKAIRRKEEREKLVRYDILKHNLNHMGDQQSKIAIPGSQAYDFVTVENIIRCEGWQKYTKIYLQDGACIVSSYNLGVYRQVLKPYEFYDCHKSHLINKNKIKRYMKEGIVVMSDDSEVPVSRRKKEDFVENVVKNI